MSFTINLWYVTVAICTVCTVVYFAVMHAVPKHEYREVSNNALMWAFIAAMPIMIIEPWTDIYTTFGMIYVVNLVFICWMIGGIIAVYRNKNY